NAPAACWAAGRRPRCRWPPKRWPSSTNWPTPARMRPGDPMLVFSTSDKGGTGRSVTSANLAYRLCLTGRSVGSLAFAVASPTAGALFEISNLERGLHDLGGTHSYLLDHVGTVHKLDIGAQTSRTELRRAAPRLGRLVLVPGDEGGAEFLECNEAMVKRCQ